MIVARDFADKRPGSLWCMKYTIVPQVRAKNLINGNMLISFCFFSP